MIAESQSLPLGLVPERDLWKRFADAGDLPARDELVRRNLDLARRLAQRYRKGSEPFDDVLQVANLALLKAVSRYRPERGIPFGGFATPTILGELKRHFRDRVWNVRVPRRIHDLLAEIEKATTALQVELQRTPTATEVAARLEVGLDEVLEAIEADSNRRTLSLDRPLDDDEDRPTGLEWVGAEDRGFELVDERARIEAGLYDLDEGDRRVIELRFVGDLSQSEIAERVGCSQMQISRILRRSLAQLRESADQAEREDGAGEG